LAQRNHAGTVLLQFIKKVLAQKKAWIYCVIKIGEISAEDDCLVTLCENFLCSCQWR